MSSILSSTPRQPSSSPTSIPVRRSRSPAPRRSATLPTGPIFTFTSSSAAWQPGSSATQFSITHRSRSQAGTRITDQNGTEIDQGFDDLDRLTARDITLGSGVGGDTAEDFAYDALGRLTESKDDDSIVQMTYDSLSRVLTEVQGSNPLGTTGKTVTYTWDAESNRTKIDYPSGFDANEARDALGRLTAITDGSSATVASFDLYGAGLREKKRTLANSTYTEMAYDGFRRPTDIDHKGSGGTRFAGYAYAWDANDNPCACSCVASAGRVHEMERLPCEYE